jgi:hypothetical protein
MMAYFPAKFAQDVVNVVIVEEIELRPFRIYTI